MLATDLSVRDPWVNSESSYLLVKMVRPAPGAQSRPRANPERGEGPGAPICGGSKTACVYFADRMFLAAFTSLLLRIVRKKGVVNVAIRHRLELHSSTLGRPSR
jgi:hypothetical protein